MPTLLRLDSSPREEGSHSRAIADLVEQHLQSTHSDLIVTRRDLSMMAIPPIANETITGFYTPEEAMTPALKEATSRSDELIAQLKSADSLLISAPMYNFSVPSSLKAWIDQIVRINETFSFDGASFKGLVPVKRAILALSYGAQGYTDGGGLAPMNFFEPYLVSLLTFLGVEHIEVFRLEGTSGLSPDSIADEKAKLSAAITQTLQVLEEVATV
ncbi:MAG: NAD(P)H-dependent oxidoreductase [Hahellaceae bacterium]|nr:NAD(P)H-dependent oxidoreductase [Hahellaceae bacterium]MCP5168381.1 NAD(P)H-dependent oxidoreductase [Hahellaceae bacterium]